MSRWVSLMVVAVACLAAACGANVEQERNALVALDREWSEAAQAKNVEKFLSYYAPDASVYPQGMPIATGSGPIRETITQMFASPGFSIQFGPTKAEVSASGDLGYTTGTYQMTMSDAAGNPMTETGKYVTAWKKQSDGLWKATEDIFNADAAPKAPASQHVTVSSSALKWGDAPPSLPPGARLAVVSGDPTKTGPFTLRAQVPAGYRVPGHWHPTDEHLTVLSGTVSLGMGDKFDEAALKNVSVGGYVLMPAEMRHFFLARTAATFQVHGMGPFVVNYVNPADDPRKK